MGQRDKNRKAKPRKVIDDEHFQLGQKGDTEFSKGLAETHQLINDHYFEGTIDQRKQED